MIHTGHQGAPANEVKHPGPPPVYTPSDLRDRSASSSIIYVRDPGTPYYGQIEFHPLTGAPIMEFALPIFDLQQREILLIFAGTIRVKNLWNLFAQDTFDEYEHLYMIHVGGRVVVHRNSSVVLHNTCFDGGYFFF